MKSSIFNDESAVEFIVIGISALIINDQFTGVIEPQGLHRSPTLKELIFPILEIFGYPISL